MIPLLVTLAAVTRVARRFALPVCCALPFLTVSYTHLVIHGLKHNKEIDLLQTYHDNFGDPEDDVPVETSASEAPPAETNNL